MHTQLITHKFCHENAKFWLKKRANNFSIGRKKPSSVSLKALQIFFLQELLPCELEKPQQMIAFYIPLIRLGNLIQVGMHGNVVLFMVTLLHGINLFFRLWSLRLKILKPCYFLSGGSFTFAIRKVV